MDNFCPYCEKETKIKEDIKAIEYEIRGEIIPIEVKLLICEKGHEFDDPKSDDDSVDRAYREYRNRAGLLQPEEIKELRLSYDLTQKELSNLIGWGGATLSRYENGALQSESHDRLLKMIRDPKNLLSILKDKKSDLPDEFFIKLLDRLEHQLETEIPTYKVFFERYYCIYDSDEYSGYVNLNLDKIFNSILFFAREQKLFKTKLNKLLFFADFKHFKEYAVSITGVRYAHLPYGPGPDKYDHILTILSEENRIEIIEEVIAEYIGEVVFSKEKPDLNVFSPSELKTLLEIQEYFSTFTSKDISELSHAEVGYQETTDGEFISYEYAETLQI